MCEEQVEIERLRKQVVRLKGWLRHEVIQRRLAVRDKLRAEKQRNAERSRANVHAKLFQSAQSRLEMAKKDCDDARQVRLSDQAMIAGLKAKLAVAENERDHWRKQESHLRAKLRRTMLSMEQLMEEREDLG